MTQLALFALFACVVAPSIGAQICVATCGSFGTGNSHSAFGRVALDTTALPIAGGNAQIEITYANPNSENGALLFSPFPLATPATVLGVPIYFDTNGFNFAVPLAISGNLTLDVPLDPDPALCSGVPFSIQGFFFDLSQPGTSNNLIATNRIDWLIGDNAELIITEIMKNPAAVSDAVGEYFELHNAGTCGIDLLGWTISDAGTDSHTITSSVIVEPGGYAVLGVSADLGAPGALAADYVYGGFSLGNGADEVILTAPLGRLVDQVFYVDGAFPDTSGVAMHLNPTTLSTSANDIGANWCDAVSVYATGDRGTPGQANDPCQ